jgi:choline dehydrogenase-like flavoprotein
MAYKRPKADVVIIGLGWAGSTMAEELTRAGLNVVAIERGGWRDTETSFPTTVDADELRGLVRKEILQSPAWKPTPSATAPTRRRCRVAIGTPGRSATMSAARARTGLPQLALLALDFEVKTDGALWRQAAGRWADRSGLGRHL